MICSVVPMMPKSPDAPHRAGVPSAPRVGCRHRLHHRLGSNGCCCRHLSSKSQSHRGGDYRSETRAFFPVPVISSMSDEMARSGQSAPLRRFATPALEKGVDILPGLEGVAAGMRGRSVVWLVVLVGLLLATRASAQSIVGTVKDEAGGVLPGVVVAIHGGPRDGASTATDNTGTFRLDAGAGSVHIDVSLVNFSTVRRTVSVPASGSTRLDVVLRYVLNADVTVTGKRTFTNLADADHPAEDLVGIAQSASQGAITARQLEARPIMRSGGVLETVPGVVISQHSGEGKANQFTCAASTSITAPTSPRRSQACQSTCRHTDTARATRI